MSETFRNETPAQERRDIRVSAILVVMGLIVLTVGIAVWIASAFPKPVKLGVDRPADDLRSATHYLTAEPAADIEKYQEEKRQEITTYGWTDAHHTSAHVPIDRAMQMLAAQSAAQEQRQ